MFVKRSENSSRIEQEDLGRATSLGVPFQVVGWNSLKVRDSVYNLIYEIHKALSSTGQTCKSMKKDSDISMMNNIKNGSGYAGDGDKSSKCKFFFLTELP